MGTVSGCANPPRQAALTVAAPAASPAMPAQAVATPPAAPVVAVAPAVTGVASWYHTGKDLHRTTTGELLDNNALTAASSSLPMGTMVRVGRVGGNRSVVLRVNDRMPRNHRLIDVTENAAKHLGLMNCGVAKVTVTPVAVASAP